MLRNNMKPARPKYLKDLEGGGDYSFTSFKKQPTTFGALFVARTDPLKHISHISLRIAFRLGYVADNLRTGHSGLLGSPLALGQRRRLSPLVHSVPPESSRGTSFAFPPACSTRATQATGALHEVGSHLILTALLAGSDQANPRRFAQMSR